MALKNSAYAVAAAATLFGATMILDATPASAACRGSVEAYAQGLIQNPTQIIARNRWRSEVRRRHGFGYTRWAIAKDKVERCRKITPGRRWHCTARARPCNS